MVDFLECSGKVALVTGGAQGIGAAVVQALAKLGMVVAAIDYNAEKLNGQVSEWKSQGLDVHAFAADVSEGRAIVGIVDEIERDIGPIETLVNVAGVLRTGLIGSFSDQDWEKIFAVNTTGVFNVSRSVSTYMMTRKRGSIVTVGSNAASVPRISLGAYAASKAAAVMFTKCLGLELAQYNIRCNIVSPGSTDTEMQWSMWNDENGAQAVINGMPETFKVGIPLNKIAAPSDIVDAILFFISNQSNHITMSNLCVDGGATLGA
ncbi:2,3-dihydro-2,3-dihydroxybenzoate dehydrogenase [Bacillus sp. mrc49]|nr:2,3-dihydro-2,3-dihydroxybenzoate dehydrogenase [Bacillus sp. mrc49]PJN89528.1 2,3-dihydro-2,3-dihydroxybenzoate dehydrogenase [Bacillus sp. mrc49]